MLKPGIVIAFILVAVGLTFMLGPIALVLCGIVLFLVELLFG